MPRFLKEKKGGMPSLPPCQVLHISSLGDRRKEIYCHCRHTYVGLVICQCIRYTCWVFDCSFTSKTYTFCHKLCFCFFVNMGRTTRCAGCRIPKSEHTFGNTSKGCQGVTPLAAPDDVVSKSGLANGSTTLDSIQDTLALLTWVFQAPSERICNLSNKKRRRYETRWRGPKSRSFLLHRQHLIPRAYRLELPCPSWGTLRTLFSSG